MLITSLGGPTLKIGYETSAATNGAVEVLINPYGSIAGLPKLRKQQAHIVLASRTGEEYYERDTHNENAFVITTQGEYEVKSILINAREVESGDVAVILYRLDVGNVSLGYLGGLSTVVNGEAVEHLEGIDILVIPVGGKGVLTPRDAVRMVSELEPKIVIPIEYRSTRYPTLRETVLPFLREIGGKGIEPVLKLKVTKKDLPLNDRRIVLLE